MPVIEKTEAERPTLITSCSLMFRLEIALNHRAPLKLGVFSGTEVVREVLPLLIHGFHAAYPIHLLLNGIFS
jgi:hypothetical protein